MKTLFGSFFALSAAIWAQSAVSPDINGTPIREFGHPSLQLPPTQNTPNYVEGRELYTPGQIAFDNSVNPPILYVADVGNNRVLAFKNSTAIQAGQKADLVIGQQDLQSTLPQGNPNGTYPTGLTSPTGIAVDAKGGLFVADAGNNRILHFLSPFAQNVVPLQPDLVIGQKTFSSGNLGNLNGSGVCANNTIYLSTNNYPSNQPYIAGLALDGSGNLWVTDPVNSRVLMFPAGNLAPGTSMPQATIVLGQNSFTACSGLNYPNNSQTYLGGLNVPASVAVDSSGNVYVADSFARVLYYAAPIAAQGQVASRVLGVVPAPAQGQTQLTYPNQYSLGVLNSAGNSIIGPPNGVFTLGNHLFVADTGANRIVEYDVPANWSQATTATPSPANIAVVGQTSNGIGTVNGGLAQPTQYTLSSPYAGAFAGTQLWVADTGNNRLLSYAPVAGGYSAALQVVGQTAFSYNAPNLIEGRELYLYGPTVQASAMVIDNSTSTPHLYVADPGNNRILCFKDARIVGNTTPPKAADMVIGQPDLFTSEVNYPNGQATLPSQTGLNNPIGVVVDNNGNLYVADAGNGRVLRFPAPFNQTVTPETAMPANLVLGQSSFTSQIQVASANSMHTPWGLALFAGSDANTTPLAGGLAVSDPIFNRVLIFKKAAGGDFTNGEAASLVIGQQNFTTVTSGSGQGQFNSPRGIAADTSDRLYVADAQNNRISEFIQAPQNLTSGPTASNILADGFNFPQAVIASLVTTELWVADSNNGRLLRFPEYNTCLNVSCAPTAGIAPSPAIPLGFTLDTTGNVIVGDSYNHLTFFYAQAFYKNVASYNTQPIAPGMLIVLGRLGQGFSYPSAPNQGLTSAAAQTLPWPTTLGDINVTVNGTAAPIFYTGNNCVGSVGTICIQVPYEAPTSGYATFVVSQASTGAVLGVGQFAMAKASPAFFTANQTGSGQIAALNLDNTNTPNGPNNPIAPGKMLELCLTGYGQAPGAPADGAAPTATASTGSDPTIYIDGILVTSIGYSGLGCGYPGLWQINLTVPSSASASPNPNAANSIVLTYLGIPSHWGGNPLSAPDGTPGPDVIIPTTIFVGHP